ncbi:16S rRNA (uracil(1498)-N(3))-methyltransferase [Rhodoferax sp. GW822-FHT02A01]|uniref:16S rRNA (uracil(1498)-N(3))-methyltransferase n=1 Tax=Rhodoferax sp. GW822-FHT02A01 TaxID=3141537 RepID=UPI00315C84F0
MPRFYCPAPLQTGALLDLPAGAARHVQVLRLQPGDAITLFNHGPGWAGTSPGGEFDATVTLMGRSQVQVQVGVHHALEREAQRAVHLAVGMPANERMDWLVEKAAELGVASIQPLMTERSVLRLAAERAAKKVEHWQGVAIAACEQCGGNRVPVVHGIKTLHQWLTTLEHQSQEAPQRLLLSLREGSVPLRSLAPTATGACFLSGPEGGLSAVEESAAIAAGFAPVSLGARVLRAETAALTALALLA